MVTKTFQSLVKGPILVCPIQLLKGRFRGIILDFGQANSSENSDMDLVCLDWYILVYFKDFSDPSNKQRTVLGKGGK